MNSELEKLIEKYRITVNGLADLESGYDQVIKERGFVTLNGLLVSGENTEVHNEQAAPVEPTPVVPAPSDETTTVVEPAPSETVPPTPTVPVEQPGVTPVADGPVSGDTNLGGETASGESAENAVNTETHNPSEEVVPGEESSEEEESSSDEPTTGGKPKKKKK